MKNVYLLLFAFIAFVSCKKNDSDSPSLQTVQVQLAYPSTTSFTAEAGTTVTLSASSSSYVSKTDNNGVATFSVPVGVYEASATDSRSDGGTAYNFNGLKTGLTVSSSWVSTDTVHLDMTVSESGQVIIKEVYVGGVPKDDGSGIFMYDKYVILYNNSASTANLGNICIAMIPPYNAQATNPYYNTDGTLRYASENWIPAVQGFWYFQNNVSIEPGKQIVVALNNAVDNTLTYSKSINFNKSEYYAMYDITKFPNTSYYVTPADAISTDHYLTAAVYGTGNAWALSTTTPGLFLFTPEGTTPAAFAADANFTDIQGSYTSKKVPVSWVVDGVEAYLLNNTSNKKRFLPAIDAGYVYHLNGYGYSIYRNVNKEATEAIAENSGKIVYTYSYGTTSMGGTTDPSGIDAEASIKKGARIVYKDTNNSTNDFHLRSQASLRD